MLEVMLSTTINGDADLVLSVPVDNQRIGVCALQ
jgi:hypothetical protein